MNVSAPRSLPRADLASALGASHDGLAESARASLEDDEAPGNVEVWTTSRTDLLSVYEERLANADAGEGPATSQLREYTEVLRDENTPGLLGEAGWGIGNTYYVALLDNARVLAVTTVARAVAFLEGSTTHLDGGTFQWVAVKTFGIGEGFNDLTLIKNTVSQWAYADDFQGLPVGQQVGGVHGPVRLDEIDPRAFTPVSATAARGILQAWADQVGNPSAATQAALTSDIFGAGRR